VGLSRRSTLDFRPLIFPTLSSLICSFRDAYAEVGHEIHYVTLGLPFPRKDYGPERIFWHFLQTPVLQRGSAQVRQAEWTVLEEMWDKFFKAAPRMIDVMRKASASATATANTSSISAPSVFVSHNALKSACGLAPTAPLLHPLVSYDSSEAALIYHPVSGLNGTLSGTIASRAMSRSGPVGSDDESNGSGSSDDEQNHGRGDSDSEDGEEAMRPRSEEQKSLLSPTSAVGTRISSAQARRLADRAERRRNRQLVMDLKGRYRNPDTLLSFAMSPPSGSPVNRKQGPPVLRLNSVGVHSPARSPPPGPPLRKMHTSPSVSSLSKSLSAMGSPTPSVARSVSLSSSGSPNLSASPPPPLLPAPMSLPRANSASTSGPLSARLAASSSTALLQAAAVQVRTKSRTRAAPARNAVKHSTSTNQATSPTRRMRSVPRSRLPKVDVGVVALSSSSTHPLNLTAPVQFSFTSPQSSTTPDASPPVGEGSLPPLQMKGIFSGHGTSEPSSVEDRSEEATRAAQEVA
jgi:hypothetical protein